MRRVGFSILWLILFCGIGSALGAQHPACAFPDGAAGFLGLFSTAVPPDEKITAESGNERVFLETVSESESFFVHEPIVLRLRFSIDQRFFEAYAIQPFRKQLDTPVQIQAPWLDKLPGTILVKRDQHLMGAVDSSHCRSLALNDGLAEAVHVEEVVRDGRTFVIFEIARTVLPVRPGNLKIPGSTLRFSYASQFKESLINGRVPIDRFECVVKGAARTLRIEPLPEEGRPAEFTGAVGRFSVRAEAQPLNPVVGESVKLVVRIEGEGNLTIFDPPHPGELEGFHVRGSIEDRSWTHRTIIFDLMPLNTSVDAVPPIRFAFFDTVSPARYRMIETEPIPLAVRPQADGTRRVAPLSETARGLVAGKNDLFGLKPVTALSRHDRSRQPALAWLVAAIAGPWLLALGLLFWLRARERDRLDPAGARARTASARFRSCLKRCDCDPAQAFAAYLAARLRRPDAAVIAPDLEDKLLGAGIPNKTADRAAALLAELVAKRYGSGAADKDRSTDLCDLVGELERDFQVVRRTP